MSRKHKRNTARAHRSDPAKGGVQAKAEEAMRAARYKDAIGQYKALPQEERTPDWAMKLAEAYAGRARQLAEKDMLREALAMWRTRAEICSIPLDLGPCLLWLIRLGEWEQVLKVLERDPALLPELRIQAETQLARIVLSASEDVLARFPPQNPLMLHRGAARAALAAYAGGDEVAMNAHLSAIPFRSPFRDLRAVLKAMLLLPTDREQARALIERVPADGPFEALLVALRICILPGEDWLAPLGKLDKNTRALVFDIKGCPPPARAAVSDLSKSVHAPAALYDLVARHRAVFPPGEAARFCLKLLPHVPDRIRAYRATFAALSSEEQERILALGAELKRQLERAEAHWQNVINAMPAGQPARAALILNHIADFHHHGGEPGELCEHGIEFLQRSLALDDGERQTHLRLIRALRIVGTAPETLLECLDGAVKRFPNDVEILLDAMEGALSGGDYTKGAALAKRVLDLDPINPKVRAALGQAHLSQARKQIVSGNHKAARRELEEAGQWLRGDYERAAMRLLNAFAADDQGEYQALMQAAVADLGGNVVGIFHMLFEAAHTQRNAAELLRWVEPALDAIPPLEDMAVLADVLGRVRVDAKILHAALAPLAKTIERAASLPYSETTHLQLCEALHRCEEYVLTRRYAETALQRWPRRPVFIYLRAAAIFEGNAGQMPEKEYIALEKALEAAEAQGDTRTASRLNAFLIKAEDEDDFEMPLRKSGMPALPDTGAPNTAAALEAMLMFGGEDAFLELVRKQLGKREFEDMRRSMGGNKKQFARQLMDIFVKQEGLLDDPGTPPNQSDFPAPVGATPRSPSSAPAPRKPRPAAPGQRDFFDD